MSSTTGTESTATIAIAVIAVAAAVFVGWQGVMAVPIQIGALIDGAGLSEPQAGMLGTFEITTVALVTMLLAARIGLWSKPRVALIGLALVVLGQIATAFIVSYPVLLVARIGVGIGAGVIYAAACACIAGIRHGDRIFAWGVAIGQLGLAGLLLGLPFAQRQGLQQGVFVTLAVSAVAVGVLLFRIPDSRQAVAEPGHGKATVGVPTIALFFTALTLFNIAIGMLWGFAERRAAEVPIDPGQLGFILAALPVGGVLGSIVAGIIGGRFGRLKPLAGALFACTAACFVVATVTLQLALMLSMLVLGVCELFVVSFMVGTASTMDRVGRFSTLAGGATLLTYGFGPGIGGFLSSWGLSAAAICEAAGVFCLVAGAIAIPVGISMDRRMPQPEH